MLESSYVMATLLWDKHGAVSCLSLLMLEQKGA